MAATAASESTDGPVLSVINKRIRALRKKHNRIIQMEEAIAQGKPINKEQEEVLRSKPSVIAAIDELEKLRAPLSSAVSEEISLALEQHSASPAVAEEEKKSEDDGVVEDLLNLLYFGSMFDVKSQSDFNATMFTRTHERGCCLTYDYVTDDATDLLGERDLDLIAMLRGLLISRPVNTGLSHKDALRRCIEHAKLWLKNSDLPIDPNANVSYAGLREKLNKIIASDYFTITPEIKAPVDVAAANNYASFQVPVHGVPTSVPVQVEDSLPQYQSKEEETINFQGHETSDNHPSPSEELQNGVEAEIPVEEVSGEQGENHQPAEAEHSQTEIEPKEQQYASRRNYQNQRGGRGGGGRRGYSNGRGGRNGGRGGGGYQNGRNQYYDQPGGNYYPRNYYNNNRGRGGRGGGHPYNNHGTGVAGGHAPADVGVAS